MSGLFGKMVMANVPGLGEVKPYTLTITLKFLYRHDYYIIMCFIYACLRCMRTSLSGVVMSYVFGFCINILRHIVIDYARAGFLYVCVVWYVWGSELGPVPWPPTEHSCYETSLYVFFHLCSYYLGNQIYGLYKC